MVPSLKSKKRRIQRSQKAGLIFPVSRLERGLRKNLHRIRLGSLTSVFLAAVLEYLSAELLELSGNIAKDDRKKRITPRHLFLAVAYDQELKETLSTVTIPGAGVVPRFLMQGPGLPKSKTSSTKPKPKIAPKPKKKKSRGVDCTIVKAAPATPLSQAPPDTVDYDTIITKMSQSPFKILSETKLSLGQQLVVVQGDLLAIPADAIINPTNNNYYMGGFIGEALKKTAGATFQKDVDDLLSKSGPLQPAGVSICPVSGTLAKFVIHCNGPQYHLTDSRTLLATTIKNCLIIADSKHLVTLAIPSVGSGRANFPKKLAAEIIIQTIQEYFSKVMDSSLRKIFFVLFDAESIKAYQDEIKNLESKKQQKI